MPLPRHLLEELGARRATESVAADRDTLWDYVRTAFLCLMWSGLGIFCILWSAHTTNLAWGRAAFFAGLALGNGGIIFTLLAAYRRGERRGDW